MDLSEQVEELISDGSMHAGSAAGLLEKGRLRTLPGIHPCDGFFAAMIGRR